MTNETSRMTKEEAFEVLQRGGMLSYAAWIISSKYLSCHDGCCDDSLENAEDAIDRLALFCDGEWESVYEI